MFLRNLTRILFAFVAISFGCASSPAQEPTANEILAKVTATYANCRTYYDEGSIKSSSGAFGNGFFRTTFVRPKHLAFEFWFRKEDKDQNRGWVVWKNGDSVQSWLPSNIQPTIGQRRDVQLDRALDRLASASAGGSLTVTPLLAPNWFRLTDFVSALSEARLTGTEKIDGRDAFRIEGKLWQQQPVTLWVDKTQYLIVKTWRRVLVATREVEATVHFKAKVNTEIPPENLLLKVPVSQATNSSPSSSLTSSQLSPPTLAPRLRRFGSSLSLSSSERERNGRGQAADEDDVVRVDTDLVVAAVLVMDGAGKIVPGLTKDDFVVKEDGNEQEVASFSMGDSKDVPRSIVLIIDYSGSQLPYIETSIEAAKMLVDKLNPKDRMAVVTDDVQLLADFTGDKELLKSRLDSLKARALAGTLGASEQYDALLATVTELFSPEDARPIVIFQTDGDELEALKGGTAQPYNIFSLTRKFGLQDILTATERSRATVYSVISGVRFFEVPQSDLLNRAEADWRNRQKANVQLLRALNNPGRVNPDVPRPEALERQANIWVRRHTALAGVAKFTGAWTEFLEQPEQADEIYNRILTDIDRRYVVGYYPTNRARDGKRRKVHVEVRGHPEYSVWGQKSYFARDER